MIRVLAAIPLIFAARTAQAGGSLIIDGLGPGAEVMLDGRKIPDPRGAISAGSGTHILEVRTPPLIRINHVDVTEATESHFAVPQVNDVSRSAVAVLDLEGASNRLSTLAIDGNTIIGALSGAFTEIWIEEGEHRLQVEDLNAEKRAIGVRFDAGSVVSLLDLFTTVAPIGVRRDDGDHADGLSLNMTLSTIAAGAGTALAVVGSLLLIQAQNSRDVVRDAPVEDGHKVGISMREAWLVEQDARTESTIGAFMLGGAVALLGGAVIYWISD